MNFPLIGLHTQEVSEIVRECGLFHLKAVSTVIKKQACEILGLIPPMIGHWISGTNLKKRLDPDEKITLPAVKEIHDIKMSFLRSNHESIKPTDFKFLDPVTSSELLGKWKPLKELKRKQHRAKRLKPFRSFAVWKESSS